MLDKNGRIIRHGDEVNYSYNKGECKTVLYCKIDGEEKKLIDRAGNDISGFFNQSMNDDLEIIKRKKK